MDSPDASVGAMDAPNEALECGGDSSTILGKRPAENEAAEGSPRSIDSFEGKL